LVLFFWCCFLVLFFGVVFWWAVLDGMGIHCELEHYVLYIEGYFHPH
jgi:hypothetical protein